jgi:hypothetical protein
MVREDGVAPPESEDMAFTEPSATTYGIFALNFKILINIRQR